LADVQNTVLAAWLCFSPVRAVPILFTGATVGRTIGVDDQAAAGVLMWVPGSIAFLLPLFWIGVAYFVRFAA